MAGTPPRPTPSATPLPPVATPPPVGGYPAAGQPGAPAAGAATVPGTMGPTARTQSAGGGEVLGFQTAEFQAAAEAEGLTDQDFASRMRAAGYVLDPGSGLWFNPDTGQSFDPSAPTGPSGAAGTDPALIALEKERLELERQRLQMDSISRQLEEAVAIGMFEDQQALDRLDLELNALLEGQQMQLSASEYAVPAGAEFHPGFGPGGIASQVAEEAGLSADAGVVSLTPITVSPGAALGAAEAAPVPTPLGERAPIKAAFEGLQKFGLGAS